MYIYMYELENMLLQMQEHLEKVVTQAKADLRVIGQNVLIETAFSP